MSSAYHKTPTIYQMEATECGAASLSMIFAYWGKFLPLEQMRIETAVSRDGCSAGNIMRAAKRFGLECHGYRKELGDLKELEMPCIIHWNFNHFVVLDGFKGKYAYLNDPAIGRRRLSIEELDEGFTGIVLTFHPTDHFTKERKRSGFIDLVRARLSKQKSAFLQLLIIGLLLIFPGMIIPVLSQLFLDEILGRTGVSWFGGFIAFMAAVILFQVALNIYKSKLLLRTQNKMTLLSTKEFVSRLFRLPMNFFDQRYVGDLVSRVENNNNVNIFLTGEFAKTVLNVFVACFYFILLMIYSPTLTLLGCIGIVINIILIKITAETISNKTIKLQQDKGKLNGAVCAGISITSTLKASGAENTYTSRILGYEAKAASVEQEISRLQTIVSAVPSVVSEIMGVLILIIGALFVIRGNMTMGMLAAFVSLFSSFSDPLEELVNFVKKIQTLKADMNRVDDIMRYPMDASFEQNEYQITSGEKLSGKIECNHLTFGYNRYGNPLIKDFSFRLNPGSSVAFVGASGSGKSTVSKMISGLYQPWEGEILLDGVNKDRIHPDIIHASIATVSQNITLFSGSIRDNLTLWNPAILEQDMISAAKDACIHETITQMPGAYDFHVDEGGGNLSGGQRQRLEIARALVLNPTILIMDEATSALDPIVEKQIIDNIKRRGCTCIIVAHRLSAVRDSDEIIVLQSGKIVQRGSHAELSSVEGFYRNFMAAN